MSSSSTRRPSPFVYAPPADAQVNVLHVDDDVLIVSKPSGLLSVPGRGEGLEDCVESRVRAPYPEALIVHRLDMDTSGVMVLARNKAAHRHLGRQFEKRLVEKVYVARVWGVVEADYGEIDAPLICDWPNRPRQMIDQMAGREALTAWEVLEREPGGVTRVRLKPRTGRSHQLRVHMMSIDHPILGDSFYAHDEAYAAASRLQLHACRLSFGHPSGEGDRAFEDACPF